MFGNGKPTTYKGGFTEKQLLQSGQIITDSQLKKQREELRNMVERKPVDLTIEERDNKEQQRKEALWNEQNTVKTGS